METEDGIEEKKNGSLVKPEEKSLVRNTTLLDGPATAAD